jgi:hypothetical protein
MTLAEYLERCRDVPGWLHRSDACVFRALTALQTAAGVRGDLLEIGAYHGRSAILLGYCLADGERLVVCDPFEDQPSGKVAGRRHYGGLTRRAFETNYAAHHAVPPVVLPVPSTRILAERRIERPLRFVHVDGSHEPEVVASDIATARALALPGGVVAFEDDHSVHTPGVNPAVRAALERGELAPLALTPGKTYALVGDDVHGLRAGLARWAAGSTEVHPETRGFAGGPTLMLYPLPRHTGPWTGLDRKSR